MTATAIGIMLMVITKLRTTEAETHRRIMHKTKVGEKTFHYPIMKYTFHRSYRPKCRGFRFGAIAFCDFFLFHGSLSSLHRFCTPRRFVSFHLAAPKMSINYTVAQYDFNTIVSASGTVAALHSR